VLEDHRQVAFVGSKVGDGCAVDEDCATVSIGFLEAGKETERGGLSATGGTQKREELAGGNL
jgi:hypothetical protein